jgi:hypothetical protein
MAPLSVSFQPTRRHRQAFSFSLQCMASSSSVPAISAYNGIIVKLKRSISAYDFFFKNITI